MDKATVAAHADGGKAIRNGRARARPFRCTLRARLLIPLCALCLLPSEAVAQTPPDEHWRTIETERFRVTFPAHLEALARRAGARAERAWEELSGPLPEPPKGRVDLVLTDHADYSNGFATVAPRRRIVVFARPPVDGLALSYFDDWMELVITHELAHIFHLDVTGTLGRALRAVFGRVPAGWPFFPQFGTPAWVVEGLGTYYESALTTSGRADGTYHEMMLRTEVLEDALEGIDAASGDSPEWPAGDRPYAYGASFFQWLLARHGPERMADLIEAIGGQWIPYRLNAAARQTFGTSFSAQWRGWTGELETRTAALRVQLAARAPLTTTEPIARGARHVLAPAVSPDGTRLAFARADGRSDAQIRLAAPDGSESRRLTRTNDVAFFSWAPDGTIVLAQVEYDGPYRLKSDLYRVDESGRTDRLTENMRLDHPAVSRDGRSVLAIRNGYGTTELVRVDLATGAVTPVVPADPDVHWAFPAPSPDGRWIAASRWRSGRSSDVVLLAPDGRVAAEVTADRAVDSSPSWSPDGRWLLWSSDRTGIHNVMAVSVDASGRVGPARQVTNVLTGITHPSVDPTGRWIYGSVYHAQGWEVERFPFAPDTWTDPFPTDALFAPTAPEPAPPPSAAPARDYRAARTMVPGFWEPLVLAAETVFVPGRGSVELLGPAFGFATAAEDVVSRHSFEVAAAVSTTGARLAGSLGYRYAGLGNPVLSLSAEQDWDGSGPLIGRRSTGQVDTLFLRERARGLSLGASILLRRFRASGSLSLSAGLVEEDTELLDSDLRVTTAYRVAEPSSRLADLGASLSLTSARSHALAISAEDGAAASVQARIRRHLSLVDSLDGVAGGDRSLAESVARLRFFRSLRGIGLSRHVLALRGSAGVAGGPGADRFHYDVGGAGGVLETLTGVGLFGGSSYAFPVRGYHNGERSGRFAWSAAGEYRFPIVRVNRGWGLVPLHLDQVSGTLFVDVGNAWGPELGAELPRFQNPRRSTLRSVGGELSADVLALFTIPVPLRLGVAFPLVNATGRGTSPVGYVRLGSSF